ncbi:MAG: rhodanese-related sulfurtransferase [Alphaproteobacteria bacterium TMED194]|nr:MAG: rhodanese-related sulfurtransferase [Alphaproteobacteria bacterium TMED194]
MLMANKKYTIISYYNFIKIKNLFKFKNILNKFTNDLDVKGIILIAPEGLNLSISIYSSQYNLFIKRLNTLFKILYDDLKISYSNKHIFRKIKIKIKKEILTTRIQHQINIEKHVGEYVSPIEWDNFIKRPDVLLIDTRNFYETEIGSFIEAINPKAKNFTELLNWLNENMLTEENKKKKIALFCTGGIRCEKATSYLKHKGHNDVYHLEGGIIKYLEKTENKSSWHGECFVFDDRVSVNKKLNKGSYKICYACRMPLSKDDIDNEKYIKGVSCHKCYGKKSQTQIDKYQMRNKQLHNINDYE